jgi:hypothetical protein
MFICYKTCGLVAKWLRRWSHKPEMRGFNPHPAHQNYKKIMKTLPKEIQKELYNFRHTSDKYFESTHDLLEKYGAKKIIDFDDWKVQLNETYGEMKLLGISFTAVQFIQCMDSWKLVEMYKDYCTKSGETFLCTTCYDEDGIIYDSASVDEAISKILKLK